MSASCEVTQGVGGTWVTCPTLLRGIWDRGRRAGFRCWSWLSAHVWLPCCWDGRLPTPFSWCWALASRSGGIHLVFPCPCNIWQSLPTLAVPKTTWKWLSRSQFCTVARTILKVLNLRNMNLKLVFYGGHTLFVVAIDRWFGTEESSCLKTLKQLLNRKSSVENCHNLKFAAAVCWEISLWFYFQLNSRFSRRSSCPSSNLKRSILMMLLVKVAYQMLWPLLRCCRRVYDFFGGQEKFLFYIPRFIHIDRVGLSVFH